MNMNKTIYIKLLLLALPGASFASGGAGMGQAIFYTALILFGIAAFASSLLIYGIVTTLNRNFKRIIHVVIFNTLNFLILFFIILLLNISGLSSVDDFVKILVALLGITQFFMLYKSLIIYRHNKQLNTNAPKIRDAS